MDDYKKFFYASTRVYEFKRVNFTSKEHESVQRRIELRKSLKCQSFEWYLYNLIPELETPPLDALYYGELMNMKSRYCWEVQPTGYVGLATNCFEHKLIPKNYFRLNVNGLLQYKDRCVTFDTYKPALRVAECPKPGSSTLKQFGQWKIVNKGHVWGVLEVTRKINATVSRRWCISQVTNIHEPHKDEQMPQLTKCKEGNKFSIWIWTYKFDFDE